MQSIPILLSLVLLLGFTAMVLGGGSAGRSKTSAASSSDAKTSAKVRSQLTAGKSLSGFDLSVRSHSGAVILGGSVDNHIAREPAGCLAKATDGIRSFTNQIVVE